MDVNPLDLDGVLLIHPSRYGDDRGLFSETYQADRYRAAGVAADFVQDNLSRSATAGTIRGLHFQAPPHGQAKLIQCVCGRIFDVAVDLRRGSPTYGRWTGAELDEENGAQMFVPVGFAHGFMTLAPDTIVTYKASAPYAPEAEGGLRWDDGDLAIGWPSLSNAPILSDRDRHWGPFSGFSSPFSCEAA